jgi:AbiV family abortive infection protein
MDDEYLDEGFLQPMAGLSVAQIGDACEAALGNAVDLLNEAEILRRDQRCARAYFLAHIACEELGKLPILLALATSQQHGFPVDWKKIDRVLRSHGSKIRQVLFMDSLFGEDGLAAGEKSYEADLKRLRTYTDMKNASLYSFYLDGTFHMPSAVMTCEFVDTFLALARSRLNAFEAMYMRPIRAAGGLDVMFDKHHKRVAEFLAWVTSEEGRDVLDRSRHVDERVQQALLERLLGREAAPVNTEGGP